MLCPDVTDDRDPVSTANTMTSFTELHEFSTYRVTVNASYERMPNRVGEDMTFTTESSGKCILVITIARYNWVVVCIYSAPTGAPGNLAESTTQPRSITVTWDEIDCIERNGIIDRYTVEYQPVGGDAVTEMVMGVRTFTANNLRPFTDYIFRVRGGNSAGMGDYSNRIIARTDEVGMLF